MGITSPLPSTQIFVYCAGALGFGWAEEISQLAKAKHNGTWHCFNDEVRALPAHSLLTGRLLANVLKQEAADQTSLICRCSDSSGLPATCEAYLLFYVSARSSD